MSHSQSLGACSPNNSLRHDKQIRGKQRLPQSTNTPVEKFCQKPQITSLVLESKSNTRCMQVSISRQRHELSMHPSYLSASISLSIQLNIEAKKSLTSCFSPWGAFQLQTAHTLDLSHGVHAIGVPTLDCTHDDLACCFKLSFNHCVA